MRPIDADELKMHTFVPHEVEYDIYKLGWNDAILAIVDNAPTIDTVKHGKWMHTITFYPYCSECDWMPEEDEMTHGLYNYCPECGAKMDGGEE